MSYSKEIILATLERLELPASNDGFVRLNELTGIKAATFYNVVKGLSKELSFEKVLKILEIYGVKPEDVMDLIKNSNGQIKPSSQVKPRELNPQDRFI